ncbi:MAG: 1-deoxy-D-xylulose-5-phosphate reductoisomerase [Candidatus Calescibacterium sp.]|nr:1-deoxy-D-xylulose-5-phosphate reductoisomerase [Candidatus Calescibacterium sp.]MCX7733905.1 1-deoxy-D-xylulose-5-phosphate reductoisomerase [bacterium]MDW8086497.1 1-deoxy-D-xylulose-5-phosphate reductoisomerase [Candidatus Calescibacterium sp.]
MNRRKKGVAILGSTGSIGRQTLEVIESFKDIFEVVALTANRNIDLIYEQIKKYRPKYFYVASEEFRYEIEVDGVEFRTQKEIIMSDEVDLVVVGIPGFDSLEPVYESVRCGKKVAVASKEAILCGGKVIFSIAESTKAKILPIDSEHSSLWRIIDKYGKDNIKKVYITASGGPFLNLPKEELEKVKIEDALKHPVWSMGKKITIDSASLMNKAFEVIEASYLFGIPSDIVSVKIHPEAIVHSAVEYKDGTTIMSAHFPDMRIPILYSMLYGDDFEIPFQTPPIWDKPLRFYDPDVEKFPAILFGWRCAEYPMPVVLVSADDVAVELFLENRIKFTDITKIIDETLSYFENYSRSINVDTIEDVFDLSKEAKNRALNIAQKFF